MELNVHQLTKNTLYLALRMYGSKLRESQKYEDIKEFELDKLNKIRPIPSKSPHYLVSKTKDEFNHKIKPFSLELLKENKNEIDDLIVIKSVGTNLEVEQAKDLIREEDLKELENNQEEEKETINEIKLNHNLVENILSDDDSDSSTEYETSYDSEETQEDEVYYTYGEDDTQEYYYEDGTGEYDYEYDVEDEETYYANYQEDSYAEEEQKVTIEDDEIQSNNFDDVSIDETEEIQTVEETPKQPITLEEIEKKHKVKKSKKPSNNKGNISPKVKFLQSIKEVQINTNLTPNGKDKKFMVIVEEDMILLLRSKLNMTNKDIILYYKELGLDRVASRVLNKLIRENKVLTKNGKIRLF